MTTSISIEPTRFSDGAAGPWTAPGRRRVGRSPAGRVGRMAAVLGLLGGGLVGVVTAAPVTAVQVEETFGFTGGEQTFTVPARVTSIHVVATGAGGAVGRGGGAAGRGAVVTADLSVTPGQVLYVEVGGAPTAVFFDGPCPTAVACGGGFNGGGESYHGGGGGGATDVRTAARAGSGTLDSRLVVAAGGGGSGQREACYSIVPVGGAGGDAGAPGSSGGACPGETAGTGGGAGTQTEGGAGGNPFGQAGSVGLGGRGGDNSGGAGGGGLYGGGGGGSTVCADQGCAATAGGGGGSSLVPAGGPSTVGVTTAPPGVVITYTPDSTGPTVSCSATPATVKPIKSNNHKLVTINTTVTVTDEVGGSGPDGFILHGVTSSQPESGMAADDVPVDIQDWTTGTADTSGRLRIERYGQARVYRITYQGADLARNTTLCTATVTVPKG